MNDEIIILQEAQDFFKSKITHSSNGHAIGDFHEIKNRLLDFYTPETKVIFLNEIARLISFTLENHRNKAHGGKPGIDCPHEIKPDKLLFYIKQELATLPIVAHQRNSTNIEQIRNKVFVSYSQLNKNYLTEIKRHFKPFLHSIDFWDDTKIAPGQKWKKEIEKAINETKVAILLLSTDFLGSDFISKNELPPLLKAAEENGAVILIVILEPCLFEEFDALNQFQSMNSPNNPVLKMANLEREELYVNLVRQTKRILATK